MAQIFLNQVDLTFPISYGFSNSLRASLAKKILNKNFKKNISHLKALSDINIHLKHGDCLGLIGANGSGKTTLLRLIAGIYKPTSGYIEVNGNSVTMFDLNYGGDEEASGFENIKIAGTVLGMDTQRIKNITDAIADFSELGEALDRPIKTYSSGMRVRLAFGLISSMQADILLIDEIIGVGDTRFMKKASTRIHDQIKDSSIVVLASHAESVLRQFCNIGLVLDAGQILFQGSIDDSIAFYNESQARIK
jgi:ABC-2 type transport system ATP-binding protein